MTLACFYICISEQGPAKPMIPWVQIKQLKPEHGFGKNLLGVSIQHLVVTGSGSVKVVVLNS